MTMRTDITWTDGAWARYQEVVSDCYRIGDYYGVELQQAHLCEFLGAIARLAFAAGPVNIQTDGDGFLLVQNQTGFVVGLVWTPDSDEAMLRRLRPAWRDETIRSDWPRTGRWSAHS